MHQWKLVKQNIHYNRVHQTLLVNLVNQQYQCEHSTINLLIYQLPSSDFNPLKPDVWERSCALRPLEINEGVSEEQNSLNTIFNTHKIRIVCKI